MALLVNHRLISFSLRPKNISLIENLKLWGHSIINLEQNDQKSEPPPPPSRLRFFDFGNLPTSTGERSKL